jgi:hypothetical protein
LVGTELDHNYINQLIEKAERLVSFKIRYLSVSTEELNQYLKPDDPQLLVYNSPPSPDEYRG